MKQRRKIAEIAEERNRKTLERTRYGGLNFINMLLLLFIYLRLSHQIEWAWIWVLSPLWITVIYRAISLTWAWFIDPYK